MKRQIRFDDSSNVTAAAYDGDAQKLTVTFSSGASYVYSNVQPHQYGELAASASAGSWVRSVLVKQPKAYPCAKLTEASKPGESKLERYEAALQLIASLTPMAEVGGLTEPTLRRAIAAAKEALA